MKCPICETRVIDHWLRGFLIGFFLALLIGFIGGQFFYKRQYEGLLKFRIERLELANQELRKGYVPPKPVQSPKAKER